MFMPQPRQFICEPPNLRLQFLALPETKAIDNLPQPFYLGLQALACGQASSSAQEQHPRPGEPRQPLRPSHVPAHPRPG